MKVRSFVMAAVMCVLGLANAAKADTIAIGTNVTDWGTVFSGVEREAYYHHILGGGEVTNDGRTVKSRRWSSTATGSTVDTWEYRADLMGDYLATLGSGSLSENKLMGSRKRLVRHKSGDDYGQSRNDSATRRNIYGEKAELLLGNMNTSGVAAQMFRNGDLSPTNIIASSASNKAESVDHNWTYNSVTDTFTSEAKKTSTGIGDHDIGIYAFVTTFNYNSNDIYQYLNGWFSELGDLVGIYVNGFELTSDYLKMTSDYLDSRFFASYDMEIDLEKLYNNGRLNDGNNNVSFVLSTILPEFYEGTYYDGNDGLLAFASGLNKNSESIFPVDPPPPPPPPSTPEPATLLILGAGLVGLGIRKRLSAKK
ncbi:MAG: PEP-CTERM sorting domain-containing protein [Planctomycetaceae bacterium]|nr:PEP-CTERM sorting domain-containing protein [Planctomycetaceae bacterium]